MVGLQGKNRRYDWRHNRTLVLTELMKEPMHFSGLLRKLKRTSIPKLSSATLVGHLDRLVDEGLVKRKLEGRKVVFVVVEEKRDRTVLDMRIECLNELGLLMLDYGICLTKKTKAKLNEALDVLKESIDKREQDADVALKMMGYPQVPIDEQRVAKLPISYEKKKGEK